MGAYLSSPDIGVEQHDGVGFGCRFGVGSMQGWRTDMEDSHLACTDVMGCGRISLFGVFDGHGGMEVAEFCAQEFPRLLKQNADMVAGNYRQALKRVFFQLDEIIQTETGQKRLIEIVQAKGGKTRNRPKNLSRSSHPAASLEPTTTIDRLSELPFVKRVVVKKHHIPSAALMNGADISDSAEDAIETIESLSVPGYDSGSTGVVALIVRSASDDDSVQVIVANAGDSRAVIGYRTADSTKFTTCAMSNDHKPNDQVEYIRIYAANGFVENGRVNGDLNLSRALGDLRYKDVSHLPADKQKISVQPDIETRSFLLNSVRDLFLMIGCDGVWNVYSNEGAVEFVGERILNFDPSSLGQVQQLQVSDNGDDNNDDDDDAKQSVTRLKPLKRRRASGTRKVPDMPAFHTLSELVAARRLADTVKPCYSKLSDICEEVCKTCLSPATEEADGNDEDASESLLRQDVQVKKWIAEATTEGAGCDNTTALIVQFQFGDGAKQCERKEEEKQMVAIASDNSSQRKRKLSI